MSPESDAPSPPPPVAPRSRRRRWRATALALLTAGLLAWAVGCTSTVVPPPPPVDPVDVWLFRDERHLGLLLPSGPSYVEFGYGEWDWYARNQDRWYHVFDTMLWPTRGTLGRRRVDLPHLLALAEQRPALSLSLLRAERAAVDALRGRLDAIYERGLGESIWNDRYAMRFVPHEDGFWFGHNCSDAVADWLRALGCEVARRPVRFGLRLAE